MGVVVDYIQVKMFSIISLIFLLSTAYGGDISLFEGNNGSQDEVCTLRWSGSASWNFKDFSACANDEARSAILHSADYGTTITLYDSPNGDKSDDYVEIKVKGYTNNPVVIGSFESTKNIMLDMDSLRLYTTETMDWMERCPELKFQSSNHMQSKIVHPLFFNNIDILI